MDITLLVVNLFSITRAMNYNEVLRDRRCNRGQFEPVNNVSNSNHSEPQNKRRKLQDFLCLQSEKVDQMIDWLENDEITTIGIYGMGGIGKTALANQLQSRLLNHHSTFTDTHAYVSVGLNFTIYQLQQKIASALGLNLDGDKDEIRRSGLINAFLSRNKNCILILDDLWGDFRREDVGIPTKCRVTVISRSLNVCRVLRCQKVIQMVPLTKEQSWKLFHYSIGYTALDPSEIPDISNLVHDKCAGLPVAIKALSNALKGEINTSKWKEILESEDPFSVGQQTQLLEDIFSQLKKSYDELNSKSQRCFLYAASYPKDLAISKEELIRLWIREGVVDEVESLQVQYDMGHSMLNKLLNTCLLENCQDKKCVKMHDFIRRMALSIREDFMVKGNIRPSELDYC